jgi:hypothetical protein
MSKFGKNLSRICNITFYFWVWKFAPVFEKINHGPLHCIFFRCEMSQNFLHEMGLLTSTQKIWGFFWKQNHQICRDEDSSFTKITHYKLQHCNWDQAYLEILCPSTTKSELQKNCRSHRDSKRHTKTFIWQDEKTTRVKSFNYLATKVVGLHHSTILVAKTLITTNLQCSNCWALFPLTGKWPREDLAKFGYKPDMKCKYKPFPFPLPDCCSLFNNYWQVWLV